MYWLCMSSKYSAVLQFPQEAPLNGTCIGSIFVLHPVRELGVQICFEAIFKLV